MHRVTRQYRVIEEIKKWWWGLDQEEKNEEEERDRGPCETATLVVEIPPSKKDWT